MEIQIYTDKYKEHLIRYYGSKNLCLTENLYKLCVLSGRDISFIKIFPSAVIDMKLVTYNEYRKLKSKGEL